MVGHQLFWNQSKGRVYAKDLQGQPSTDPPSCPMTVNGSCHCQEVKFTVQIPPAPLKAIDCNCSMCAMRGYLHLIIPRDRISISEQTLRNTITYSFNTGVAKHTFCKFCGVQAFYTPRSNPECVDVNVRCLQLGDVDVPIEELDGQNFTGTLEVE